MAVRVAVIDDDAGFRRVAVLLLRIRGYDVVGEADDVASTLELIAAAHPDAVLIDYHLANGDGVELCTRIAALDPAPRLLLTSSDAILEHSLADLGIAFVPKERLASVDLGAYFDASV